MTPLSKALAAAAVLALAALGAAQIERLDLAQMVQKTDGAVVGTIVGTEVIRIDSPVDGPELYYTHLLVQGTSLYSGQAETVAVTYAGGFISPTEGVWNSEAPTAAETRIGNEVVVFYKWSDNVGGDLAANALYASHGGLYRTAKARNGETLVLGRGDGYAVDVNRSLPTLRTQISALR